MNLSGHLAKHFREVHFGGNWADSNLKDILKDVSWIQATQKVYDLNTIATLVFHMNYYVSAVLKVLEGGPLDAHDKFSFDRPPLNTQESWDAFLEKVFAEAERFADVLEELPEERIWENFTDEKYGIYYRNIHGIIEHTHYHLGQVALVKKILSQMS